MYMNLFTNNNVLFMIQNETELVYVTHFRKNCINKININYVNGDHDSWCLLGGLHSSWHRLWPMRIANELYANELYANELCASLELLLTPNTEILEGQRLLCHVMAPCTARSSA